MATQGTKDSKQKKNARIPKKLWGASKIMAALSRKRHQQLRIEYTTKMKMNKLEEERDKKIESLKEGVEELFQKLHSFAEERKKDLTKDAQSVSLVTGKFGWRMIPPSVVIQDGFTEQVIIETLRRQRKKEFLRITTTLNREEILEKRGEVRIRGVEIKDGEEFFVSLAPRGRNKPKIMTVKVA